MHIIGALKMRVTYRIFTLTRIGRKLIEAVYKAADANGTPSVYWLTEDFNKPARRLYEQVAGLTPFIKYQR